MAFGMEMYDSSGTLQANCELLSYFCRKTGTGTTVSAAGIGNTVPSKGVIATGSVGYTYPLIAVSCPGYTVARVSNGASGDMTFACSAPVGTAFTYYIFDYSPALPASAYGIELYDGSGQRTFSSNYFPMQVVNVLRTEGSSATYSGRTLAAGLAETGGFRYFDGIIDYYLNGVPVIPDGPGSYNQTGYRNNSKLYGGQIVSGGATIGYGTVSFDDVYIGPVYGDITPAPDWSYLCPVLAVDVTGIPIGTTFF